MREHNYEIELHDMLLSADSAEDLLAYRKADLIFSIAPINNRSMVCVPYVRGQQHVMKLYFIIVLSHQ